MPIIIKEKGTTKSQKFVLFDIKGINNNLQLNCNDDEYDINNLSGIEHIHHITVSDTTMVDVKGRLFKINSIITR